jgi:hypothetical protein
MKPESGIVIYEGGEARVEVRVGSRRDTEPNPRP